MDYRTDSSSSLEAASGKLASPTQRHNDAQSVTKRYIPRHTTVHTPTNTPLRTASNPNS